MQRIMYVVVAILPSVLGGPMSKLELVDKLQTRLEQGETTDRLFRDFKAVFNKLYEDGVEEAIRRKIFALNVDYIRAHNLLYAKGEKSYTVAVNQFADLTHTEFMLQYTGLNPIRKPLKGPVFVSPSNIKVPASVDWRDNGYVTPVKNQGHCGACWAFSTTGSMEGQVAQATGKLVSLSEQQLVDCSTDHNCGCRGGLALDAYPYIEEAGGIESESSYPYKTMQASCRFNRSLLVPGSAVDGFVRIPQGEESSLQDAVATVGPISVSIDAHHCSFKSYKSGVFYEPMCSSTKLNHAVLAVGYGTSPGNNSDFWLVKNSWGATWGEKGYIKMARNRGNNCGVATRASYPLLKSRRKR